MSLIKKGILFACIVFVLIRCNSKQENLTEHKIVTTFSLDQVKLLDGPFKHATELNIQSLLRYEPDRLLSKFRSEAGLEPKAEHYHGWEDETIAGHSLGHYLSACALMYRTSGDERFLERVKYIVDELEVCQNANGGGYVGAFPDGKRILEEQVARGEIRAQGFDLNGIWVPYYNLHKTMAGLRDAYRLCENEKALIVEQNLADWVDSIVTSLNDEQVQHMLDCEHGGINEVLVDLYADTRNEKYLRLSYIFHHKKILDSLAHQKDILPGIHGNTQIPKLIGLARRYELTGDEDDYASATFFWDRVVNHHSYVTGGHGNHEYFGQPDHLRNRLSDETTETCNVYNMLKLSSHIFQWDPKAEIGDYYERALFNQILSSQHPDDGRVIYNLSLEMGGYKHYEDPEGFTCCVGTGMENHSKYGRNIFYHNDSEFYVVQFIASEVSWPEKSLKIIQKTEYPKEQATSLIFETEMPQQLTVMIRNPYWVENGITVHVNDEEVEIQNTPSGFIKIDRVWNNNDEIRVEFPFSLRLEEMPDDKNRVAIMYGPLVMAGDLGPVNDPHANDPDYVPVLFAENRDPGTWLNEGNGPNVFKLSDGIGKPRGFVLQPFYMMHDRRYSVYWDIFNEKEWKEFQEARQAEIERKKKLEEMTFDFYQPGDSLAQLSHQFTGDKTTIVTQMGRKANSAERGGWFSMEMKVIKGTAMSLVVEYWGGYTGSKTFDILVNGTKVGTQNISGIKDGSFLDIRYDIPDELISDRDRVEVKFSPHVGHRAGPVFAVRTVRR